MSDTSQSSPQEPSTSLVAASPTEEGLQYGSPVPVGNGRARTYVLYNQKGNGAPLEIGVALDSAAMEGLPTLGNVHTQSGKSSDHDHPESVTYLLSLPERGAAPFRFVALDWSPNGHVPPGVYDLPHFDFHFWMASRDVRASIVPGSDGFQEKAEMLPPASQTPPFYAVAAPPGAPAPAVPLMGVHWVDVRSPELQPPQSPAHRPFTATFVYGSWEGRFVLVEPMITRDYILSKRGATDAAVRNEVLPVSTPARVVSPGYYPSAYRIAWDARAREFRVALTRLARRE